jgi:predicted N-acetyltransferase YhbS
MSAEIRHEVQSDIASIRRLTEEAFALAAHTSGTEHLIIDALRAEGALTISLVALVDKQIVGHVAISPVSINGSSVNWYGLGPISVSPTVQNSGVGTFLMHSVLAELKDIGANGCVLLGDPGYYKRFGFKTEPNLVLPNVPPEYFQAISFDDNLPTGEVSYHKAFEA